MSHGALLTAITALHAPDLVKNIICQVPITNTKSLLENKFGSSWITEYGNPESADWDRFMASEDPIFFILDTVSPQTQHAISLAMLMTK